MSRKKTFPALTEAYAKFVDAVQAGMTLADAYAIAYPNNKSTREIRSKAGSRLMKRPEIVHAIEESREKFQKNLEKKRLWSKEQSIEARINELRHMQEQRDIAENALREAALSLITHTPPEMSPERALFEARKLLASYDTTRSSIAITRILNDLDRISGVIVAPENEAVTLCISGEEIEIDQDE